MTIEDAVKQATIAAMKARESERTTTLRMVTAALKNKAIEKRARSAEPLTEAEAQQVLAGMIKQRRDSVEQFTAGNRPELAAKETAEIAILEEFLPKALSQEALQALVQESVAEVAATSGQKPTAREMGLVMKAVQARLASGGHRAEGRVVSEVVKAALA